MGFTRNPPSGGTNSASVFTAVWHKSNWIENSIFRLYFVSKYIFIWSIVLLILYPYKYIFIRITVLSITILPMSSTLLCTLHCSSVWTFVDNVIQINYTGIVFRIFSNVLFGKICGLKSGASFFFFTERVINLNMRFLSLLVNLVKKLGNQ